MRYLAVLVLMALLLGSCVRADAPALSIVQVQATPVAVATQVAKVVEPKRRLIPPGLRVSPGVAPEVLDRWYALAYMYPDVAKRITRIEVRRAGGKGWTVSYERTTIYLNADKGVYVQADALTQQFARRAFAHLQRYQPATARTFRTWQRFAAWLAVGVR